MYVQQPQYSPYKDVDHLYNAIEEKLKPKRFGVILHDKDDDDKGKPEAPQLHAMMEFENARSVRNIAKLLKDKPQYVEAWDDRIDNGFSYLIHRTKTSKHKHQYDPSEVKANFNYVEEIEKIEKQVQQSGSRGKHGNKVDILLNELYLGKLKKVM